MKNSRTGPELRAVEVNRLPPFVLVAVGEVIRRELFEIVSVRPHMIVDHVEDDPHSDGVGSIDKAPKIVRRSVKAGRRKKVNAVVSPAEAAGEVSDRHYFEHSNSECRELRQLAHGRCPRALSGERADVHLVNDLSISPDAGPFGIAPAEVVRVDHLGRAMRAIRLKAGGRIGIELRIPVQSVTVKRTASDICRFPRSSPRLHVPIESQAGTFSPRTRLLQSVAAAPKPENECRPEEPQLLREAFFGDPCSLPSA